MAVGRTGSEVPFYGAGIRVKIAHAFRTGDEIGRLAPRRAEAVAARGFSLIELMMVLVVTAVLTGLLLPVLTQIKENAFRIMCSSNLRQIGFGIITYADENNDNLPFSYYGQPGQNKQEMMAAHRGEGNTLRNWEGLGWLYVKMHLNSANVFYCPSHDSEHHFERYQSLYEQYRDLGVAREKIYTNYQYVGNTDWGKNNRRRRLTDINLVLAADGMRTLSDINHEVGMNLLRADGSVHWKDDASARKIKMLITQAGDNAIPGEEVADNFTKIWDLLGD